MGNRPNINASLAIMTLVAALLFAGALFSSSCTSSSQSIADANQQSENSDSIGESREQGSAQQLENDIDTTPPADDRVVNAFIVKFNSLSPSPLSDVEQGNIRTKYHAQNNSYYFELLHANDTDKISVSISQTNESSSQGTPGMRDVFMYTVKAIDSSIPDDEIGSFFDSLISGEVMVESAELGKTVVSYVPDKELSGGHSRGHITVAEIG